MDHNQFVASLMAGRNPEGGLGNAAINTFDKGLIGLSVGAIIGFLIGGPGGAISEADLEAEEEGEVEVQEGESLEDIKAKLKPKKAAISAEMLDTANTYDDKVAVIRMIVGDEAGKVSNVFRQLMKKDAL